jgi:predicted HicB family RNase H-like nuclease
MMSYKGYVGRVTYDDDAGILYGEVTNTDAIITFIGTSVDEIRKAFRNSVEFYLEFCAEQGDAPEQPRPVTEQIAS